ncbi:hypothetical protein MUK70_15225 [Dyadobacter chenwenxiniae]|uniref:Uncharacterized protein n=1 Tax=Dyadobacter chenwenxiniae TaxID=2906456 RepID=A0A9X1TDE3_9BACT|nr:hypothetical protein [Dyadobacter chenwenxiniae]MCF0060594.1 hypothetical protein [Dyadobacter chenwenxiniae]UON86325.1 hypothetical protein MUK70_15225 [Dyadobacter chenwenxiniae]
MNNFYRTLGLSSLLSVIMAGCGATENREADRPDWNFDKSEITDTGAASTEKLNVDVYLDVTGSMEGFSVPGQSDFGNFVDDIESTCQNTWKKTDIKYFKYGSRVDSISRSEFVSAKNDKAIFTDKTLNNKTDFANTIKNTDPKRVSILITDLFYNNNDINSVVGTIKEQCIQKGIEIGVVGVSSAFNGSVGDLGQGVSRLTVNAQRPLFALVFGDKTNIDLLFRSLQNKPYITGNRFLILANKPTESFDVALEKDRKSKSINRSSLPKKQLESYGTVFAFTMKEREKEALLHLDMTLLMDKSMPDFTEKNIKAQVFKRKISGKDSVAVDSEIRLENLKISGGKVTADIKLNNADPEGIFSYAVYLTMDNTVPLAMPKWIKDISTDSIDGVQAGKTLNLEKLLTDIATSHATAKQPKVAKFYIYLEKK